MEESRLSVDMFMLNVTIWQLGGVVMTEGHIAVRISGKDLESVTGSVKGILQSHIRATRKYDDASFELHRREGRIVVAGVPRTVVEAGLNHARAKLLPERRFSYHIEEETVSPLRESDDPHVVAEQMFVQWTETTQKEWEERVGNYEATITRLTATNNKLQREVLNLKELRRQDQEQLVSLKKSYDEISHLLERVSEERSKSPLEMSDLWVEDWAVEAKLLEQKLPGILGDDDSDAGELIRFDLDALRAAVTSAANTPEPMDSLEEIEKLASGPAWEDTEDYARLHEDYEKARTELEYLESLERGEVSMPESLKEKLLRASDRKASENLVKTYEDVRDDYARRTAQSSRVAELIDRYHRAERLRQLVADRSPRIPVVVACQSNDRGWQVEIRFPRSDGAVLRPTLQKLAEGVLVRRAGRKPEVVEDGSLCRVRARLAGKFKSWKDASRAHESICLQYARDFNDSTLAAIGFQASVVEVMAGPRAGK
jgi:hypothetical protein